MITQSAILKDEVVYTGKRHHDILANASPFGYLKDGEQGFIDANGKFLNREDAAQVAFECGQIKKEVKMLFSEDLW